MPWPRWRRRATVWQGFKGKAKWRHKAGARAMRNFW